MTGAFVLTYVEIDVDRCSLTYGTSPCVAAIPTTGDIKCFNSLASCQDRANFANTPITYRFAVSCDYLPRDIECIPNVDSVSLTPGMISLGKDLGTRSSLSITFKDHRHSDAGPAYDKYPETRTYDPYKQGTYWGKFRARNPYMIGRNLRLIRGVLGQALEDMETRHYVIESFSGPSPSNTFTIIAKDVLKLASGDRAQAPRLSNGRLSADINNSTTSATLAPSGIGNEEYPASGYVCIGGKEICSFTRSGNALTLVRGRLGTTADSHSEDDRVQLVLRFSSADPADIISDLLIDYAGVDPAFIPLSTWQAETGTFLQQLYTGTVSEPTAVEDLISELIEQAALAIWWDDIEQLIKLQVLRQILPDARLFDGENIMEGSLSIEDQPNLRISQVWTFFAQRDPTKSLEDEDNYRSSALTLDIDAEANYGVPAIKKIHSRWIPFGGRAVAEKLNALQLGRFKTPPRKITFNLFRAHDDIQIGNGYRLADWTIQDATGAPLDLDFQVTRLNPRVDMFKVEAEELLFDAAAGVTDRYIYIDSSTSNINLRTIHDSFYPVPTLGDVGAFTVYAIVEEGVTVSSTSTGSPALNVGTWPVGLDIVVEIRGRVVGKDGNGGKGGNGGNANSPSANPNGAAAANGLPGGTAFYTRQAIDLKVSTGEIFGGRGGGGGGGGGGGLRGTGPVYGGYGGGGGGGGGSYASVGARGTGGAGPSSGFNGDDASAAGSPSGGNGGDGYAFGSQHAGDGGNGGAAGAYGAAGANGQVGSAGDNGPPTTYPPLEGSGGARGLGGAGGKAIDGSSYVTVVEGPGDIRGSQVN